jgi:hypothetical protein
VKRILVAVSFAALAVPAFAVEVSAPYEETQADRASPPNIQTRGERNSKDSKSSSQQSNPWANDQNFIAPAP